jgi:hypothetical protein
MTRENERSPHVFPEVSGLTCVLPSVVAQTNVQTSQAAASTKDVTNMTVTIPAGEFVKGATYNFILVGTKDAGNGTLAVKLNLNGTNVLTLTSGSSSAGDWFFKGSVSSTGTATQNCQGWFNQTTRVEVFDYASAAINTSGVCTLKATITNSSDSDTVTVEYGRIDYVQITP